MEAAAMQQHTSAQGRLTRYFLKSYRLPAPVPTLFRLVYTSVAAAPLAQASLDGMLAVARACNARDGVSGNLLHASGTFAQILEGPVSVVEQTFLRIEWDRRHTGITVVHRAAIDARAAPAHPMGYCDLDWLTPEERNQLGPLLRDGFGPVPSWQAVEQEGELLRAFRTVFGEGDHSLGW